jgi:sec-independent protein translocase protein TatB
MGGVSGGEFVVLLLVVAIVLGPERLPQYAQQLARLVRELRRVALGAREQIRSEMGPEFDEVDWRKLDPRQYDPRRIVRDALTDTWDEDDPLGLRSAGWGTAGALTTRHDRDRRRGPAADGPPRRDGDPASPDDRSPEPEGGPQAGTAPPRFDDEAT